MNATAVEWARAQTSLSILEKSTLLVLASMADNHRTVMHLPQRQIAELVGCSRQAVNRALRKLEAEELIRAMWTKDEKNHFLYFYFLRCSNDSALDNSEGRQMDAA